jgi:hypothetical protein
MLIPLRRTNLFRGANAMPLQTQLAAPNGTNLVSGSAPAGCLFGSATSVAMTAEKNFGHLADFLARSQTSRGQLHVIQATDGPAIDTQKVRMRSIVTSHFIDGFKPPHVVAEFGPPDESRLGQIVQISERGGFVDSGGSQLIGNFRVSEGRSRITQQLQRRHPRRGGSQPHFANRLFDQVKRLVVFDHLSRSEKAV